MRGVVMKMKNVLGIHGLCLAGAFLAAACSPSASGPNRAPVANAGSDTVVEVGKPAALDGSESFDPDDDLLDYRWTVVTAPRGGTASVADAGVKVTSITPDMAGIWAVRLVVNDGRADSEPDVVRVRAFDLRCERDEDCDDFIDCTEDTCDTDSGQCEFTPVDEECPDDGEWCNGDEYCDAQSGCAHTGDPCLDADGICDEDDDRCVECLNDVDCDDGIDCTDDSCSAASGECTSTPDNGACEDDGLYCNGTEYCDPETGCTGSGDPCAGSGLVCDEENNECVTCQRDEDCDDEVDCTDDTCDAGACVFTPNDSACPDDGEYCNGNEYCDPVEGCKGSGDPCASQSLPCDEANDLCVTCGDGVLSGDHGEECDPAQPRADNCCDPETCLWTASDEADPQGQCSGAGECMIDVCDGSGGCMVDTAPDGTPCTSNGIFCDGQEECQSGSCESPGNPCTVPEDCDEEHDVCAGCGDGVASPGEDCDPAEPQADNCCDPGTCQWVDSGDPDPQGDCSGAAECQVDVCDGSGGCTTAAAGDGTPCQDEGVGCTDDTCQSGVCDHSANNANCPDDSDFCNGTEYCDAVNDCSHTGDPCTAGGQLCDGDNKRCVDCLVDGDCDDSVNCTDDTCNQTAGTCIYNPNNSNCPDDSNYCNGSEFCDAVDDCSHTGDPCASQSLPCDETHDVCVTCGDGIVSSGQGEDCDPGVPQNDNCCETDTCTWTADGDADPQGQCSDALECWLDVCNGGGGCKVIPADSGDACGDDSDTECTDPDTCDGTGNCLPNHADNGDPCGTASGFCAGAGTCQNGSCMLANLVAGDYCDGDELVTCDGNGNETARVTCHLGCADTPPNSRCYQVNPSNIDPAYLCAGSYAWTTSGPVTIDTENGTITGIDEEDITFNALAQDAPGLPLAVFSFVSIDIRHDVTVIGNRPLALLACGDIDLGGVITSCGSGREPGPGGRAGGASESDGVGYFNGRGRGGPGENGGAYRQAGGGGGAFGGDGGDGGDPGYLIDYGAGGEHYGKDDLVPLLGGSGGGGGGFWYDDNGDGGVGGGGGGAVQLTAGGTLTISSGGGINTCGAGGSAPTRDGGGGGGGGAGGGILVEGVFVIADGTLSANGGGGGGGDAWNDDAPPAAGAGDDGPFGQSRAAGGSGADGGSDGGTGGGNDTAAGDTVTGGANFAGGGGGAAGRIRINSRDGVQGSPVTSPVHATGLVSEGSIGVY